MKLDLESERYAPTGNISGKGVERSLGTPSLGHLQILVRETVQNAWDARLDHAGSIGFSIALRTLSEQQLDALRNLLSELPPKGSMGSMLEESLRRSEMHVIEVADYGTTGLGGPTRADRIAEAGEKNDFANFFRNVGSPRDRHLGGGTYGYGKSAAYVVSRCRTIFAYTATTHRGKPAARFMAASLGDPFEFRHRNYTGRHWWGSRALDEVVDPLEKERAHRAAASLGLRRRDESSRGTTLLIVDPRIEECSLQQAASSIAEGLAWFFWPKMLDRGDGKPTMTFGVSVNGQPVPVPNPATFSPLQIFADAMRIAKSGLAMKVACERPKRHLGVLALAKGPKLPRQQLDTGSGERLIPERCSHVALMRPAELVVKYLTGPAISSDMVEYGGVFICDDDVEHEFARAEPPAHDDWIPDYLEGHGKTFVRVALRRIAEATDCFANPVLPGTDKDDGNRRSMAALADALGGVLAGQSGQRLSGGMPQVPRATRQTAGTRGAVRLHEPEPFRFATVRKVPCALFRIRATGTSETVRLLAHAGVVLEGSSSLSDATALPSPEVIAWLTSSGEILAQGNEIDTEVAGEFVALLAVSIPGDCAVGVDVHIAED